MVTQSRMSPFTAMFLAAGLVVVAAIGAGTAVTMYGISVVDQKASGILALAHDTVQGLPEFIEKLPPALADLLHDRRAPEYASRIETKVVLAEDSASGLLVPSVEIINRGTEVVSVLGLRVNLLNREGAPLYEWSELAAAPVSFEELRGPLMPGSTRYIVLSPHRGLTREQRDELRTAVEICDIRVWRPRPDADPRLASAP